MRVCACTSCAPFTRVHVRVCMRACMCVRVCVRVRMCMRAFVYVCMRVLRVCMHHLSCTRTRSLTCVCVCACVRVHACLHLPCTRCLWASCACIRACIVRHVHACTCAHMCMCACVRAYVRELKASAIATRVNHTALMPVGDGSDLRLATVSYSAHHYCQSMRHKLRQKVHGFFVTTTTVVAPVLHVALTTVGICTLSEFLPQSHKYYYNKYVIYYHYTQYAIMTVSLVG